MPADVIDAGSNGEDDDFAIWDENADTLMMFMRLQTQWRVIDGGFLGLDYQSAAFLFKIHDVANPAEMMNDLQAMEMAALRVLNKRKE